MKNLLNSLLVTTLVICFINAPISVNADLSNPINPLSPFNPMNPVNMIRKTLESHEEPTPEPIIVVTTTSLPALPTPRIVYVTSSPIPISTPMLEWMIENQKSNAVFGRHILFVPMAIYLMRLGFIFYYND